MRLKRLELFGFKSFADRTVIDFDQGITGVVGPNGSGKSNISDAIRWVLGEQSAKSLRGGRMEDIIFNGTEKRKPLAYSEVSLIFENEDRALAIDFTEVAVTRRVYRSGDSEYYINRSACRLRDVVDLFRDSGIGREGYSIIGQGKVDEILSNKPEDRRNVFHEAAGIMKFRSRKEEAERNLEKTRENLVRITDIMSVMEGQIGPLKQQSENARKYLDMAGRLKELEVNRFLSEYERLRRENDARTAQLAQLESVLAQQGAEIAQRQAQMEEGQRALDRLEETWAARQQTTADIQQEQAALLAREQVNRERLAFLEREDTRLLREKTETLTKAAALREELTARREALGQNTEARAKLDATIAQQEDALTRLDGKIEACERGLEEEKDAAMASLQRLSDVKSSLSRMEGQRHALEEHLRQLQEQLEKGAASRESWQQTREATRQTVERLAESAESARQRLEAALAQRHELTEKLTQLTQKAAHLREEQRAARTRLTMLQNMKRDYEGYNNTVKALLKDAQRDTALGGCVDAVVAEVLKVPANYLLAVETALGASGQHIITPDEQAAKRLIGHLRARQYGRATFLPLTAIRGRLLSPGERSKVQLPGLCGIASELITCEPRYREVVDNLLGRTLIAKDLDAAITLSKACQASLRVVTLQGDVMNPGGSMTGGSLRARVTSVLGRDQEIEENEERLSAIAGQLERMEQSAQRGKALAAESDEKNALLQQQLHTMEIDLAREKERLDKAEDNTRRQEEEHTALEEERVRLAASLEDMTARMEAFRTDGSAIETDNREAQQVMARHQRELNLLREEHDDAVAHLGMLRATAMADERDRAALAGQLERDARVAEEYESSARSAQRSLEENERQRQEMARDDRDRDDRSREMEERLAATRQEILALQETREAQRQRLREMTEGLRLLEQESLQTSQRRYEAQNRLEQGDKESAALQNRIWEMYEITYANALPLRNEALMTPEAQKEMEKLRRSIRALGPINTDAIEEYARVKGEYEEYLTQSTDLTQAKERLEEMIGQIAGQMEKLFRESFRQLNTYFGETFRALFGGGQAFIKLQNESNILESGIDMHVQPPGKKLQLLTLLSGGERALTAIALLFAMLRLKPTPFCILDEIEAALDEANISHFTDYVRGYAEKTQFVIITHRKSTMECCDMLYGVTMQEKGVSKLIRVRMSDIIEEPEVS